MLTKFTPILKSSTLLIFLFSFAFSLFIGNDVMAKSVDDMLWGGYQGQFESTLGFGSADPREMIVSLLRVAMSFLGIIALIMIMLAGFKWMVSGGNEDKKTEARGMLTGVIVGLVIMFASYGIINFVINSMMDVSGATSVI